MIEDDKVKEQTSKEAIQEVLIVLGVAMMMILILTLTGQA